MPILHRAAVKILRSRRPDPMTALTTTAIAMEILEVTLLTLDQISTRLSVSALVVMPVAVWILPFDVDGLSPT